MTFDPDAPGRGPKTIGMMYRWQRVGDLPVIGRFAGFVRGTTKRADTLFVGLEEGVRIPIRYEHLVQANEISTCPSCSAFKLIRTSKDVWDCEGCHYHEELQIDVGHQSEWECDECGGPSPPRSNQGCRYCGGQGDIVARGTAKVRRWYPGWSIEQEVG